MSCRTGSRRTRRATPRGTTQNSAEECAISHHKVPLMLNRNTETTTRPKRNETNEHSTTPVHRRRACDGCAAWRDTTRRRWPCPCCRASASTATLAAACRLARRPIRVDNDDDDGRSMKLSFRCVTKRQLTVIVFCFCLTCLFVPLFSLTHRRAPFGELCRSNGERGVVAVELWWLLLL